MKVFVTGVGGFQGVSIAQQLIANGHKVSTLQRSEKEILPGVASVRGSLESKDGLNEALQGADVAVYTFPLIFDIEVAKQYTSNFVDAAKNQNVSLVVFNAGFDLPKENNDLLALDLKFEIKKILDNSGLNVITLIPDVYIDNLAAPWSIPVILNSNILPYPIASGSKIPWISHADLAKFVAAAVEKPELAGKEFHIGGNLLSGEEIAEAISSEIGKSVSFMGLSPDEFEKQISPAFGELAGREISNLYRYVATNNEQLLAKDFKEAQEVLGVNLQSLTDWVKSVHWEVVSN